MDPKSYLAEQRGIAAAYDLALKALGVNAVPLNSNMTEAEATLEITRRASTMLSMALIDLYLIESKLRGNEPSETLIEEFARKVPSALERQLVNRSGTPVEELLKALLGQAPGRDTSDPSKG